MGEKIKDAKALIELEAEEAKALFTKIKNAAKALSEKIKIKKISEEAIRKVKAEAEAAKALSQALPKPK